jgi:hypothetical protein
MTAVEQQLRSNRITEEERVRTDMQAFDRLPVPYRDLVRYSPIEIPAMAARAYLSAFGQRLGLRLLKWAVDSRLRKSRRSAAERSDAGNG